MSALEALRPPKKAVDKPLRLPLLEVYKIGGIGTVPLGRVATGILKVGDNLKFTPGGLVSKVRSMEMHYQKMDKAEPGDIVGINVKGVSKNQLHRGFVGSLAEDNPAEECETFEAQVIVLNHPGKIRNGYTPVLDVGTAHVATKFVKIRNSICRKRGIVKAMAPEFIKNGDCAMIQLKPTRPLCVETFTEFPPLGRFTIRDMKRTVAVGVIKEVTYKDPKNPKTEEKKMSNKKRKKLQREADIKSGKIDPNKPPGPPENKEDK
jgi:elongation factor 1-alpha